MRIISIITIVALMVGTAVLAGAWQRPTAAPQPVAPQMPQAQAYPPSTVGQPTPQGWPATPPAGQSYAGPENQSSAQPGYPQYPYAQHHNPYYNEAAPGNYFSGVMDWLLSLPQSLLDRTTNYIDGTFFPQSPATHGQVGQSGGAADPQAESAAQRQPLPPAQRYIPRSR
jgi:hypothetical protein